SRREREPDRLLALAVGVEMRGVDHPHTRVDGGANELDVGAAGVEPVRPKADSRNLLLAERHGGRRDSWCRRHAECHARDPPAPGDRTLLTSECSALSPVARLLDVRKLAATASPRADSCGARCRARGGVPLAPSECTEEVQMLRLTAAVFAATFGVATAA